MHVRSPRDKALAGERPLFQGTAAEVRADVERYRALGVSHFVFDAAVSDARAALASMERFAADVRPALRRRRRTGA